jgi:hypothetical protein
MREPPDIRPRDLLEPIDDPSMALGLPSAHD